MSVDKFGRTSSGQVYTDSGVTLRYVNNNFLRRDGVEGDIDMSNHRIVNLSDPVNAQDATSENYVSSKYLKRDGASSMEGDLDLNNNKITECGR